MKHAPRRSKRADRPLPVHRPQDDDRLVATAVRRLRRGEPAINVLALFQQP